jgi:putative NADPH-quinone reductase
VAVNGIVALSADEFVAAEYGDFVAPTNDKAYRVVISTGAQTEIAEAEGQYMMGTMRVRPRQRPLAGARRERGPAPLRGDGDHRPPRAPWWR